MIRNWALLFREIAQIYDHWNAGVLRMTSREVVGWIAEIVHKGEAMAELAGMINSYACESCGEEIWTVLREDGTTPMLVGCRVNVGCTGQMRSAWYQVDQKHPVDWEWYRPTDAEREALGRTEAAHVVRGGLLLRRIEREDGSN